MRQDQYATQETPARRGRPRDPGIGLAVLEATVRLLAGAAGGPVQPTCAVDDGYGEDFFPIRAGNLPRSPSRPGSCRLVGALFGGSATPTGG